MITIIGRINFTIVQDFDLSSALLTLLVKQTFVPPLRVLASTNAYLNLAGDSVFVLSIISKAISQQGSMSSALILDALESIKDWCSSLEPLSSEIQKKTQ